MHDPAVGALVVEESLAPALPGAIVVARPRMRRGWGPIEAEPVLAALERAGEAGLVLARAPQADPSGAALPRLARARGHEIVILPADHGAASWVAAAARAWWSAGDALLVRRVQALASLAALRPAGAERLDELGWRSLSRLAAGAWRPCAWCRTGGGCAGGDCARCGVVGGPA